MYFVNENGKIIQAKHQIHCKCQYCCQKKKSSSFTFSNIMIVLILIILFYYIMKMIIEKLPVKFKLPELSSTAPTVSASTAPTASTSSTKNNLL